MIYREYSNGEIVNVTADQQPKDPRQSYREFELTEGEEYLLDIIRNTFNKDNNLDQVKVNMLISKMHVGSRSTKDMAKVLEKSF